MSKNLVAYFSASGVTRKVAKQLAEIAHADLFEIAPAKPYTSADLDWTDKKSRTTHEANNLDFRPEIAKTCGNIADYDVIFVGFPIWWYRAPNIVSTFLEEHALAGKTIVPFATSGGSGMGQTVKLLKPSAPNATFAEGTMLNGASKTKLEKFAERFVK